MVCSSWFLEEVEQQQIKDNHLGNDLVSWHPKISGLDIGPGNVHIQIAKGF